MPAVNIFIRPRSLRGWSSGPGGAGLSGLLDMQDCGVTRMGLLDGGGGGGGGGEGDVCVAAAFSLVVGEGGDCSGGGI